MAKRIQCCDILLSKQLPGTIPNVIAAIGDDSFLRRETTACILELAGIDSDGARTFDGEECEWLDVHDELATLSLFEEDSARVAVVTNGDRLVKDARAGLEKWCTSPAESSLLILQVNSLPATTKLYKIVEKQGWCIACSLPTGGGRSKVPSPAEVKKFITAWAKSRHGLQLAAPHAQQVLDAVGADSGLLHQELAKLALYADEKGHVSEECIRQNVGSWRNRTTWEIADAVADGRIAEALAQLERVFSSGEPPAAVAPQIAWSLRRFSKAAHLILQAKRGGRKMSAQAAIAQSGFWGNDARLAEGRLRRMGLRRASRIFDWLLDLDLKLKGSHAAPARAIFAVEEFCLRFAD